MLYRKENYEMAEQGIRLHIFFNERKRKERIVTKIFIKFKELRYLVLQGSL